MRNMNRLRGLVVVLCLSTTPLAAQGATVAFEAPAGVTAVTANTWTSVLYVNGTPFPLVHVCVPVGLLVTCTATLPVITAALTPTGPQTFEASLKDTVLGEGPRSLPFIRTRPPAPISPRFP